MKRAKELLKGHGKKDSNYDFKYSDDSISSSDDEEDEGKTTCCGILPDIIAPTSTFRTRWDIAFLALLVYSLMDIPFRTAFEICDEWFGA